MNLFYPDEYDEDPYCAKHGIDGSDADTCQFEPDEIEEHNRNLQYAIDKDEYDALNQAFPEEYPWERFGEYRTGVIVNA